MGRKRRRLGVHTLAVTLAQLSAAVLLPALDAHLEAESFHAPLHVDTQDADCAPAHDDVFCQILRSLAHGTPTVVVETDRLDAPLVAYVSTPTSFTRARSALPGGVGPRAPPAS